MYVEPCSIKFNIFHIQRLKKKYYVVLPWCSLFKKLNTMLTFFSTLYLFFFILMLPPYTIVYKIISINDILLVIKYRESCMSTLMHTHPCSAHSPLLCTFTPATHTYPCPAHSPMLCTLTPCPAHSPLFCTLTPALHTHPYTEHSPVLCTHTLGICHTEK